MDTSARGTGPALLGLSQSIRRDSRREQKRVSRRGILVDDFVACVDAIGTLAPAAATWHIERSEARSSGPQTRNDTFGRGPQNESCASWETTLSAAAFGLRSE